MNKLIMALGLVLLMAMKLLASDAKAVADVKHEVAHVPSAASLRRAYAR